MVKAKNDYDKRMDDSRFKNFDKMLDSSYGKKQYYILIIGLIIIGIMLFSSITTNYFNPPEINEVQTLYEKGLNISYSPEYKLISITFSNPNIDTTSFSTIIQIPFDMSQSTTNYIPVYEYSTSKFPVNITYSPSPKISNINHIILVTLIKDTGNYTYTYSVIPDTENKMWQGTGQYIQKITEVFNKT